MGREPRPPVTCWPPIASDSSREVQRPREVNPFKNVKPSRKKTLPETEPGLKAIQFYHNDDWEDILEEVGTKTRSISFGDKGESFRLAEYAPPPQLTRPTYHA